MGEDPYRLYMSGQRWKYFTLRVVLGKYVDFAGNEGSYEEKSLNPEPYRFLFIDDAMDAAELHLRRHRSAEFREAVREGRPEAQLDRAIKQGHAKIKQLLKLSSKAESSGRDQEHQALEHQILNILRLEISMSTDEVVQFLQGRRKLWELSQ